ncbi:hypothetical protein [Saliniramus sp.]|uniref:hypothetical protein n=1 Tax=Saliniramus sp. TaxID=2986772 RepID=UPI002C643ECE|nr:hypothetical protein [Saliniramus sp.]HMB10388.1 hypothetical protein [Saliniramus sp.]
MTRQPSHPLHHTFRFPRLRAGVAAATFALGMGAFLAPQEAAAQEAFMVCDEQRALEQAVASDGDFMPDGCRVMRLSTLDTDQGRFCVMEFDESDDPGLMDRLTDAALPDTWWMRCADLGEAM